MRELMDRQNGDVNVKQNNRVAVLKVEEDHVYRLHNHVLQ